MFNEKFSPARDTLSQTEKLEKYSGEVDWSYLKPHFKAGNLIYVDPSLDLKVAGLAFAKDDQIQAKKWLQCGDLVQPCELHAEHWEKRKDPLSSYDRAPIHPRPTLLVSRFTLCRKPTKRRPNLDLPRLPTLGLSLLRLPYRLP